MSSQFSEVKFSSVVLSEDDGQCTILALAAPTLTDDIVVRICRSTTKHVVEMMVESKKTSSANYRLQAYVRRCGRQRWR